MRYVKTIFYISLDLIGTITPFGCNNVCGCSGPYFGYFNIYYKSNSNSDLLNPQTGIYNPSDVKIDEIVKQSRRIARIPALTNEDTDYSYVLNNGIQEGVYFVTYYCSIIKYENDLAMTLIQLKPGVTDTLTFTYQGSGYGYPEKVFYNRKAVWPLGNGNDIVIIK